jgi:hypothetical protein
MRLPGFLGGGKGEEPAEAKATVLAPVETTARTPREKIDFHINRFSRALAQCEKGQERETELQAHLDYWKSLRDADDRRKELN